MIVALNFSSFDLIVLRSLISNGTRLILSFFLILGVEILYKKALSQKMFGLIFLICMV